MVKQMKRKTMNRGELDELVFRAHPYIEDIVRIYGLQGAYIEICEKCSMLTSLHVPKGMTVSGPSLSSLMYCQHKE